MRDAAIAASLTVAIGASFWGLYWVPLRAIETAGVGGGWAVALFNAPAIAAAAALVMARGGRGLLSPSVALAGAVAGVSLALYAMGLTYTTVVRATLLFYLTPVWGTLLGALVLGERPGATRWTALVVALTGLALTLGVGGADLGRGFGVGEALGLASGVAWAIGAVLVRRIGEASAALVFHQFLGVVLGAAIMAALLGAETPSVATLAGATSLPVIGAALVIFASTVAIFWALAQLSPGRSGLLMMTEVVVAVISAAILLPEEALGPTEWLGAALIVGAAVLEVGAEPQSRA